MVHIKRSKDRQWFFIVKASNGKTLVQSETYKRKRSVVNAIASLKKSLVKVVEQ